MVLYLYRISVCENETMTNKHLTYVSRSFTYYRDFGPWM